MDGSNQAREGTGGEGLLKEKSSRTIPIPPGNSPILHAGVSRTSRNRKVDRLAPTTTRTQPPSRNAARDSTRPRASFRALLLAHVIEESLDRLDGLSRELCEELASIERLTLPPSGVRPGRNCDHRQDAHDDERQRSPEPQHCHRLSSHGRQRRSRDMTRAPARRLHFLRT